VHALEAQAAELDDFVHLHFGWAEALGVVDAALSATQVGTILSAFSWTYAAAQLPGGWVLDRIGVKLTYYFSVTFWSIFTMLQGLAGGFASLLGFRFGLGASEAPCFPANSRVLSAWFPQQERARATSIFSVGMYAGIGFLNFPLTWIANTYGWNHLVGTATLDGQPVLCDMLGNVNYVSGAGPFFGFVTFTFADGSQIATQMNGKAIPHADGSSDVVAELSIFNGTGRFAGQVGSGTFAGHRSTTVGAPVESVFVLSPVAAPPTTTTTTTAR
jgi:MFS family permease